MAYFHVVAVVVKHVVNGGFLMGFEKYVMDGNAGVSTVPGVFIFARGGKTYELPNREYIFFLLKSLLFLNEYYFICSIMTKINPFIPSVFSPTVVK